VAAAWSGSGFYQGVASSHLRGVEPGREILGFVRRPNPPFAPPEDPEIPLILVGPGTGFAPLRGFLQERAAQRAKGIETSTALLFYGCRHPDQIGEIGNVEAPGNLVIHVGCNKT
jgi:cytochrome P450/NADPH-cytochrome P450 reductase